MKRHDYIKSIFSQVVLEDLIISLSSDKEMTNEEIEELKKNIREMQEEQLKLKKEQEEFDLGESDEVFDEETPEKPQEQQEPEEIVPDEEKIEMPGQLEKGQLEWAETGAGVGALKKYSPNAVLAKVCPVCTFENRPIYVKECSNCKKIYQNIKRFYNNKKRQNKNYTPEMAFEELAPRYRYVGPRALREIFETKGITKLNEINEINSSPRKELDDMLWYRLNVKKDPKTNEPILDNKGMPIPLDNKKYFSTEEMTEALHISPEKLREMVAKYNGNIIQSLPENIQKTIRKDENGEILPSSARQLSQYGFIAPAVVMGTGMADVRRRLTHDQEEKLSPEQVEGLKGSDFKSVDIAAWDWDKLKTVFGWDEKTQSFNHGWMKYLREEFLPAIEKDKLERKIGSLQRVVDKYKRIAQSQEEDWDNIWHSPKNIGARLHGYLEKHGMTVKQFKKEWEDEYDNEYKPEYKKVIRKKKFDAQLEKTHPEILQTLRKYDEREEPIGYEERKGLIEGIASALNVDPEKIEAHFDLRDDADQIEKESAPELEFMRFLEANPKETRQSLKKFRGRLKRLSNIYAKKMEAAKQFKTKAEKLEEKLPELKIELEEINTLPENFDLAESLRKYQESEGFKDVDPETEKDLEQAEAEIAKEHPTPQPKSPEQINEKTSSRLSYITRLAVGGQLGLFGPEPEEKKEEKKEIDPHDVSVWMNPPKKKFSREPNTKYSKVVSWLNNSTNQIENQESPFTFQGPETLEKALTNDVKNNEYNNLGVIPGDELFVTLTDPNNLQQVYKFMLDDNNDIIYKGAVHRVGDIIPIPETEELPEPEVNQQEKAEEAPVENFGKIKGKYFVFFEWNPDYPGQPNSYKAFFKYTPSKNTDFEELLQSKIGKRFGPKLIQLMKSDDVEDKTSKKYIHITVIEPETERRRRFGATINKDTGYIRWIGTGGVVKRKEKERRLNLEQYKDLKKEVNLGITKLEDIKLVGDNDLELTQKEKGGTYVKPKTPPKPVTDEERRLRLEREHKRKLRKEKLQKEENPTFEEEEEETIFPGMKERTETPEGTPESEAPIRKVVIKRSFFKEIMSIPVKNPATNRPEVNNSGKIIKKKKEIIIPQVESTLVTIRVKNNGEPAYASAEKIGVSFKNTGETYEKRAYPKIFKNVRTEIDKENPNMRKEKLWDERRTLMENKYIENVKKLEGENAKPFIKARKQEPYVTEHSADMSARPHDKCPPVHAPFKTACPEIKAALASLKGEAIPKYYEVYDWDTIKRKPGLETSQEKAERRRRHDVTDFFADDKTANNKYNLQKISAEYQGKNVTLNDPIRNPPGSKKKFHVFVKDKSNNIKKVQFGDPNMEIKRDDPERRRSFRARHKCDSEEAKDKTKGKYWSCYQWRANKKVDD